MRPGPEELPTGEAKAAAVREMFDRIAPRYDRLNRVLTFRLDVGWRRRTVRSLGLPPRAVVADLACGTGDLCRDLAVAGLRPVGIDVSWGMLAHARTGAPLVHADVLGCRWRTARSTASRAASRCATSSTSSASTASAHGSCGPVAGSPSSRWPSPGRA